MDAEPDRPDAEPHGHLRTLARGADYFADVGRVPRRIAAAVLAVPAAYFLFAGLITPFPAAHFAWKGEWPLAWMMIGIGAGHGLAGFGLGWLARRLWRGTPSGNRTTVLPTWLVGAFLVGFLTPMCLGMAVAFGVYAIRAAEAGDVGPALTWGAGAVGWVAGLARASVTFARLVRPKAGLRPTAAGSAAQ